MPRRKKKRSPQQAGPLGPPAQENTLDYYVKRRDPKKRDYIHSYGKAKSCPHPRLTSLSIGGTWYRCEECNWAYCIVAGYAQPLHNLVIGSAMNMMHFAKEHGTEALQEVLRRPIGQYDGTPHKPVLPEGKSWDDALELLDEVNVTTDDQGRKELAELLDSEWVGPKERALEARKRQEALDAGSRPSKDGAEGADRSAGEVPSLQEGQGESPSDRDT